MNKQSESDYGRQSQEHFSGGRRTRLTQKEEEAVQKGKGQLIPRLVVTDEDSPAVQMSSPGKGALGAGTAGALAGGGVGYGLGALLGQAGLGGARGKEIGGALGAMVGGGAAAFKAYAGRKKRNAEILETMRRLSPNAVMRDMEADQIFEAEVRRRSRMLNKPNLMASIRAREV